MKTADEIRAEVARRQMIYEDAENDADRRGESKSIQYWKGARVGTESLLEWLTDSGSEPPPGPG